ncbi:hypothetical protein SASPL_124266 [Salvia splendens]|uniref:Protodermal factor 1 n=1 Tax=Salvia splendens TaxID=180675 RepID=A0A8X8XRE9_SALSN|nr:protodermal factor 1-like [Salvia splendens]KAG6416825.1 hypothetical protein SASPL_124266 [Salvia splendens]
MESRRATLLFAAFTVLSFVSSAEYFEDQKNYYTPDPSTPPPAVTTPPYSTPPVHRTPPHVSTPPANCGTPPSHHHTSPPSGGGGYYHSPPPTARTPTTPYTPTPSTPTPTYGTPPSTPIDPGTPTTPGITVPSPPFSFDPNSPPFTCNYWRNHPQLIWGLFGWLGTVGGAFGGGSGTGAGAGTGTGIGTGTGTPPIPGANMNLLEALSNTRTDGVGALYREGTAALLNSVAHTRFPYTTNQVRDSFIRGLSSNRAAGAQAQLFKMANEGRMRPRA